MGWDRSMIPGDIEVMPYRTVLGFSPDLSKKYGQIHLVCASESDAEKGACPTTGSEAPIGGTSEVNLVAIERRSGLRTLLRASGHLQRIMSGRSCAGDFWATSRRPLSSAYWELCGADDPLGTGAQLTIPQSELARLVAGRWSAVLELYLRADPNDAELVVHSFNFDFTVTDHNAVSIYFPAFDQVTPHVGLNLQYDPLRQTVGGRALLEMCLYDGLGSQSEFLGVTVRDTGTHPPGTTGYSVWHEDGGTDDTQRVDYTISLAHSGARVPMANGVEQQLRGIDTAQLRLVMLPGMTMPVFCVPTPLTLDSPEVPISTKRSGYYSGDLNVELRLPTATP
ncbi:CfaE/CblD family pilus tip adhesin [Stenotrophomonas rhizophila]